MSKFRVEIEISDNELPKDTFNKVWTVDSVINIALTEIDEFKEFKIHDVTLVDKFEYEDI